MTNNTSALFEFLTRLGDDALVSGHRLSEWCGHGPTLEEDIALANIALDCLGTANSILELAGAVENAGRSADDLAFHRDVRDFRNVLLAELPKGDFAKTILRQFFLSAYDLELYNRLVSAQNEVLAGTAARTVKERRYHVRHCSEWIVRLALGTDESRLRIENALTAIWGYTGELFERDEIVRALESSAAIPDLSGMEVAWQVVVADTFSRADIALPESGFQHTGGRTGNHTEHLGYLLGEMQVLPRNFPGAQW